MRNNKKIAIVHDWLVADAGAEKVLNCILATFPDADLFSLVDFLDDDDRQNVVYGKRAKTTFVQKLPFAKKYFRNYLPLFGVAMRSLDFTGYDVVISSSWAFAKNIKKIDAQVHICYCHTPIRYAWDMVDVYTDKLPFFKKIVVKATLAYIRYFDKKYTDGVDYFVANSNFVADRIRRIYGRDSVVIYPPVNISAFELMESKKDYYLCASRLVGYKKTSLIVEAFAKMPDKKLVVIGRGDEYEKIVKTATSNITVLGYQPCDMLVAYMQEARGFVFAAFEDFGIAPVEAMACGTPVIAYGYGGATETVTDGVSGLFFYEQTVEAICDAISRFENMTFWPKEVRASVKHFADFDAKFLEFYKRVVS